MSGKHRSTIVDFMATWSGGPTPGLVGQDWDWSTTDLTMTVMDPCSARATLELISQDVGPIVFTDTPCMGALQDLILRSPGTGEDCTAVDLVDNYVNRPPFDNPETLYVRNIVIEANRTLDVGVPYYIHYYGLKIVGGVVASNGTPLTGGPGDARDYPFILACDTIYGDFDCDGEVSSADIDAFCAVYTGSDPYGELFDSDCDGIVNGDQDDLDHFKLNLGDPEFQCP